LALHRRGRTRRRRPRRAAVSRDRDARRRFHGPLRFRPQGRHPRRARVRDARRADRVRAPLLRLHGPPDPARDPARTAGPARNLRRMNLAVISVCALALAVAVSCVSRLNVGVLSIALAWIVGVYIGGLPVNTVIGGFPTPLFLTLTGVMLLFALAQCNGTLERLAHHAVRLCRGNRGVIPIMFFALSAALASMGPGNIATAALLIPLAMATAVRTRIPLFLMAIMAGNGANAGALSPFAPTGIIVSGLMAKNGLPGYEWKTYLYNLLAHTVVAFGGYFLFGGWKL